MSDRLPERFGYYFVIFVFMAGILREFIEFYTRVIKVSKPLDRMQKATLPCENCWGKAL